MYLEKCLCWKIQQIFFSDKCGNSSFEWKFLVQSEEILAFENVKEFESCKKRAKNFHKFQCSQFFNCAERKREEEKTQIVHMFIEMSWSFLCWRTPKSIECVCFFFAVATRKKERKKRRIQVTHRHTTTAARRSHILIGSGGYGIVVAALCQCELEKNKRRRRKHTDDEDEKKIIKETNNIRIKKKNIRKTTATKRINVVTYTRAHTHNAPAP